MWFVCSSLFVSDVGCSLFVVRRSVFVVRCCLFGVCGLDVVDGLLVVRCVLLVVRCDFVVVRCLRFVACCWLLVVVRVCVCCLCVARCSLFVVCCSGA